MLFRSRRQGSSSTYSRQSPRERRPRGKLTKTPKGCRSRQVLLAFEYRDGYNDGRQGKEPRYPLDTRSSLVEQNLKIVQQNPEVTHVTARQIRASELPRCIKTP